MTNEERCLAVLKNVDRVLLNYVKELESNKEMTSLNYGRMVAVQVRNTIEVLERAGVVDPTV